MTTGHVFLIRGDLRALQCDAIGYSGNTYNAPSRRWRDDVKGAPLPAESRVDESRVVRRWSGADGEPVPYVVPIAGTESTPTGWYMDALRVFLQRATADLKAEGKQVPKIAIPLLGASKGGQEEVQGELLEKTLALLWDFTGRHEVDVALVFDHERGFDAAQSLRRRRGAEAWPCLPRALLDKADQLAACAARGDMALFLGAGVSMGAGLPSWWDLLGQLAAGILSEEEFKEIERMSTLDYAQLLAKRLGEETLRTKVIEAIQRHHRPSFTHALLAALPMRGVATTNYDALFEMAAKSAGKPVHVLPYEGTLSTETRWLLKLHGTLEKPEDIVLSRKTFQQYEASRAALAGLFAGVLLTRHVLFIGSSFSDDNVLRIMEEVQRLEPPTGEARQGKPPRLGTCLAVGLPSVQRTLWEGEFDWVDFGDPATGKRSLEIFLDRMLASTTTSASYLFDERFAGGLSENERILRKHLSALLSCAKDVEHPVVSSLLEDLGDRLGWPRSSS